MGRTTVRTLKGDVEVRRIPPKLLREIHRRATRSGRVDLEELMVLKLVYGLVNPSFTEDEVRVLMSKYTIGTLGPIVDRIDQLSGTDEHLHVEARGR